MKFTYMISVQIIFWVIVLFNDSNDYLTWAILAGGTIRNTGGTFIKVLENDLFTLDDQLLDTALKKDQNSV